MQVIYKIRDYQRLCSLRDRIGPATTRWEGHPRGNLTGDPTASTGITLAMLDKQIEGIDMAVHDINACYTNKIKRAGVVVFDALAAFDDYGYFAYLLFDPERGTQPCRRTWRRFRSKLICKVSENLSFF